MKQVKCYDCGKAYDYDDDPFCPKCGAFNQPRKGAQMDVARQDGLSEQGHSGSFLHREFHNEERKRRKSGLDQPKKKATSFSSAFADVKKLGAAGGQDVLGSVNGLFSQLYKILSDE